MDAYIYQAETYCTGCAKAIQAQLTPPDDPTNQSSYDSDEYPKGPYAEGGGEADVPEHCAACHVFLENPLTGDGYAYVREMAADPSSASGVIREWLEFYEIEMED